MFYYWLTDSCTLYACINSVGQFVHYWDDLVTFLFTLDFMVTGKYKRLFWVWNARNCGLVFVTIAISWIGIGKGKNCS